MGRGAWMAVAALALTPGMARADDWWGSDKRLHLGASAVMPPVGFLISGPFLDGDGSRLAFGAGLSLTAGAAKELVWDKALGKGDPSWKDFTWDAIGTALGVGATWTVVKLTSSRHPPAPPIYRPAAAPASAPAVAPATAPSTPPAVVPATVRPPPPDPPADAPTREDTHARLIPHLVYSAR